MRRRFPALFLILATVIALWAPMGWLYLRAATDEEALQLWGEVGGASLSVLVWKAFLLAITTSIFSALIGVPIGYGLVRAPKFWQFTGAILTALPLGVPPVLAAAPFFILGQNGANLSAFLWCGFALSCCFFPIVTVGTYGAFSLLPQQEVDAAQAMVSPVRAIFGILRPRLLPLIVASMGVVAALSLWEMGAPDLLGVPTLSSEVYRQLNAPDGSNQSFRAALSSWPIPLLATLFLWPIASVARIKVSDFATNTSIKAKTSNALWLLPLVISPIWLLWRFYSELESWNELFTTVAASTDAIINTLINATFSAALSTFLAFIISWNLRVWPRVAQRIALVLLLVPALFAPVVLGVSLVEFFNRDFFSWLYDSPAGTTNYGLCVRFFPLALALLFFSVGNLSNSTLEAAQNLGATPLRVLLTIALPLLRKSLCAVFALGFALCAGEITITVLTQGPGGEPLSIRIFSFLHAGIASDVAALCLLLALLCGGATILAGLILRISKS
jgi:ABC-type Fe3+ transport system permease subunit